MTERAGGLALVALLSAALALRWFVLGTVSVHTSSMAPSVLPGDVLLFSRLTTPAVGDVLVVEQGDAVHVKRLVATGPGVVELSQGRLYVDGQPLRTGPGAPRTWTDADCAERTTATVMEGAAPGWAVLEGGEHERTTLAEQELWLLGDHRGLSSDARHWGPLPPESVLGVVLAVAWSHSSCGPIRWDRLGLKP